MRIVDPETRKPIPQGELGLLEIRGSNIFKCYLNNPGTCSSIRNTLPSPQS